MLLSHVILPQINTCSSLDWFNFLLPSAWATITANLFWLYIVSAGPPLVQEEATGFMLIMYLLFFRLFSLTCYCRHLYEVQSLRVVLVHVLSLHTPRGFNGWMCEYKCARASLTALFTWRSSVRERKHDAFVWRRGPEREMANKSCLVQREACRI